MPISRTDVPPAVLSSSGLRVRLPVRLTQLMDISISFSWMACCRSSDGRVRTVRERRSASILGWSISVSSRRAVRIVGGVEVFETGSAANTERPVGKVPKIRRAETASCCSVQTSDRLAARLRGKEVFVHRGAHPGAITLPRAERGGDDVEGVSPSTRRGHKAGEWESDQARSSKGTASRSAGEDKRAWPSRARPRWTLQT